MRFFGFIFGFIIMSFWTGCFAIGLPGIFFIS